MDQRVNNPMRPLNIENMDRITSSNMLIKVKCLDYMVGDARVYVGNARNIRGVDWLLGFRGQELNIFPDREGRDGMVVQNSHSRTTDLPDSQSG